MVACRCSVLLLAVVAVNAEDISLVTFDGSKETTFKFEELNDPVMGGKSSGKWTVEGHTGIFDGHVVDVPKLKAPGFIKAAADGHFADVSSAVDGELVLLVRSTTPEYQGFRVSFASGTWFTSYACAGGGSIPLSRGCFKAKFSVPAGDSFTAVHIPFKSFSDKWSPYTGDQTTTCAQDEDVCPTKHKLSSIKRIEIWAEGAGGKVHLEVHSIFATASAHEPTASPTVAPKTTAGPSVSPRPPPEYDTCKGPVQKNLRYGISGRKTADGPYPIDEPETLAEAICCDSRASPYAEPQFLYQEPDIMLYSKMDKHGVTTFYDSVCGVPLFRAPVNRTLAEFKADTDEHGWPSFRAGEVFSESIHVDSNGLVASKCGTHLGSYLPDSKGSRWCIDLSCIAGSPVSEEGMIFL